MRTLTETQYEAREYYSTSLPTTTDGLFSIPKRRLKEMVMTDSQYGQLVIHFKDKPRQTEGP